VSTRFWQSTVLPGVSGLEASFTAQHFSPHAHDALVIAVTEAGGSAYASRGRAGEADPSVLLVFNPTEPHAGHMRGSRYWRYRALYLDESAMTPLLGGLGRATLPGFTTNAVQDPELIAAFARTHQALESNGDPCLARERLLDACGRLFDHHADGPVPRRDDKADRTFVDRTLATIRDRFRERLTVDRLAASVGLSPFQLIRQFNRVTGMPPHAHLLRARLHAAIRGLRGGMSLAEAAVAAGFYDQSALTNAFRRHYGITPGQYVAARRAGANFAKT
jgi:AraC-like DNA-binding protein